MEILKLRQLNFLLLFFFFLQRKFSLIDVAIAFFLLSGRRKGFCIHDCEERERTAKRGQVNRTG